MSKPNIVIRMGAAEWSTTVFSHGKPTTFDMRKMDKPTLRQFIFAVVKTYREHQVITRAAA